MATPKLRCHLLSTTVCGGFRVHETLVSAADEEASTCHRDGTTLYLNCAATRQGAGAGAYHLVLWRALLQCTTQPIDAATKDNTG